MKRIVYLGIIMLLASCSSSKYAAHFQKSNSGFGYGELAEHPHAKALPAETAPVPSDLIASTSNEAGIITETTPVAQAAALDKLKADYAKLNKSEKKTFKKELIREMKKMTKAKSKGETYTPGVQKSQMMDHDLRLAIIFGAVGVVALLIGGQAFWIIGAIALIIGVVFFVMWLTRQ